MEERRNCIEVLEKHLTESEGNMLKKFLTVKEFAAILGFDPQWVRRRVKDGEIPAYKLGRKYMIERDEVKNYLKEQKIQAN